MTNCCGSAEKTKLWRGIHPNDFDMGNVSLIGLSGTSYAGVRRCLLAILVVLTMFIPGICLAGEPIATSAPEAPKPVLSWETGVGKSYLIPALENPVFLLLFSGYDRLVYPNDVENGKKTYRSTLSTT